MPPRPILKVAKRFARDYRENVGNPGFPPTRWEGATRPRAGVWGTPGSPLTTRRERAARPRVGAWGTPGFPPSTR